MNSSSLIAIEICYGKTELCRFQLQYTTFLNPHKNAQHYVSLLYALRGHYVSTTLAGSEGGGGSGGGGGTGSCRTAALRRARHEDGGDVALLQIEPEF